MENPAVPPHPKLARNLASIFCYIVCPLVLIFSFVFFFVWVALSSKHPRFQVDSFSLSNFTLIRNDSAISMAAQVQLTARNPNTFAALSFGDADANVYYRSTRSLGPTVLPPFRLGRKSRAPLTASFAAIVETGHISHSNGNVTDFGLKLLSSVRYEEGAMGIRGRRNHVLTVFCEGLVVGIPSDDHYGRKRPGGLIGRAPRPCGVFVS